MKKFLLFMGAVALSATAISQTQVSQGDFIIDPYIGAPNWANSTLYNEPDVWAPSTATDYKLNGGMISFGGRVEYMLADDFGIGVDLNYEISGYNFNNYDSIYNSTTGTYSDPQKYNYDYKAKKFRAMVRLNYHIVQNERVDAYTAFAAGYKGVKRDRISDDTSWDPDNDSSILGGSSNGAVFPISFRLAAGARIYFTDNIGAHIELGLFGGSIIQFGVSVKLPTY